MAADVKIMKEEIQKMNIIAAAASRSKEMKEEKESTGPGSATTAVTILDAANQAEEVASKPPIQLTTADFIFALRLAMKEMAEDQIKLSSDLVKPINRDSIAAPGTTIISKVNVLEDSSIDEEETRKKIAAVTTNKIDNIKGDDEIFKKGCGALMMYVGNVLGNPSLPRYRKISSSNVSFKSLVQNLKGHDKVLKSVGFKMNGSGSSSGFEWIWYSEANQVDSSTIVTVENGSNKEEKKIASIPTTTSNSQAGKPINDAARTEILTECMRLLEIGKKEGSVILITDLESKLENNLSSTVINTILPSIEEDSKSISNVTLTFAQNVPKVNIPNSPNAVNKIDNDHKSSVEIVSSKIIEIPPGAKYSSMNTSISTSVLDSSIKSSTGDKSLPSVPLGYTPLGFTPKYDGPVEETLDPNSSNLSDTVLDDTPLRFDVPPPIPLAMKFSDVSILNVTGVHSHDLQ